MSFHRVPDQPSRSYHPNQNLAPSSTYSRGPGLASQNAALGSPIALHQRPLNARSPSGSQTSAVHGGLWSSPGQGPPAPSPDASLGSRGSQGRVSTTLESPPNIPQMAILDMRDFSLALSIRAAQDDGRECHWYGVWAKVLQNYIFHNADGSQTACTSIPQYSLVAAYDSGHSPETDDSDPGLATPRSSTSGMNTGFPRCYPSMSPETPREPSSYLPVPHILPCNLTQGFSSRSQEVFGGPLPLLTPSPPPRIPRFVSDVESPTAQRVTRLNARSRDAPTNPPLGILPLPQPSSPQTLSGEVLPSTPPPPRSTAGAVRVHKSTRIPDFVQVLERTQQWYPIIPNDVTRRVIMVVEIKPEPKDNSKPVDWFGLWKSQVMEQVGHAFAADLGLRYLGVIMTYGCRWVYRIVRRPPPDTRTMSEKKDPTFPNTGPPEPWSTDSRHEDWPTISTQLLTVERPSFVPEAPGGDATNMYEFYLLDAKQESLRVFVDILNDLRRHNRDMWV